MAAIRAWESARPDRLFHDPLAAAFAELGAPGFGPFPAGHGPFAPGRAQDEPGAWSAALRAWVVARTVYLDELIAGACAAGGRQVVLLGAGFDARAFRLPWPSGTRCFELDSAAVLGAKEQVLTARRAVPGCTRHPVPCDLREDWSPRLIAAGLDPARPTVWIAEGLLVYLDPETVDRLVATVTGLSATGSWLGLTFRHRDPAGSLGPALRRSAAPGDPLGWLAGFGWTGTLSTAREVLAANGRAPRRPPAPGGPRALLVSARLEGPARAPQPPPAAPPGPLPTERRGSRRQSRVK